MAPVMAIFIAGFTIPGSTISNKYPMRHVASLDVYRGYEPRGLSVHPVTIRTPTFIPLETPFLTGQGMGRRREYKKLIGSPGFTPLEKISNGARAGL